MEYNFEQNKTVMKSKWLQHFYPNCYHTGKINDANLKQIPLNEVMIDVPEKTDYLSNCYGNYMEPKQRYAHQIWVNGKMPLILKLYLYIYLALSLVPIAIIISAVILQCKSK